MKYKQKVIRCLTTIALVMAGFVGGSLLTKHVIAQPDGPESVPPIINYQGTLLDPSTNLPVPDGVYNFAFRIYDSVSDSAPLWAETQDVAVTRGVFSALLGSVEPLTTAVFSEPERYLGVQVGEDEEVVPRQKLASVPYAFQAENARNADTLDGMNSTDFTEVKQLIRDFVVASEASVTAGDVVSLVNGCIQKMVAAGINYGSEHIFNSSATFSVSAAALSPTKFVVAFRDEGNFNYGTAVIGDVLGNNVSYGSLETFNYDDTAHISIAALTPTKFVVAYRDENPYGFGTAVIGDVDADTITFGSPESYFEGGALFNSVAALSSSQFVVAFKAMPEWGYGEVRIGDVSGSTISYGPREFFHDDPAHISIAALSPTQFIVAFRDEGNSNYGTAAIGNVSGNSVMTPMLEYAFNSATTNFISAAALSPTKFVVAFRDEGNSNYGTAVVGDVSDSSISYGSEYVFNSDTTNFISAAALSSTRFVVVFGDNGNSDCGTAVIGDVSGSTIRYGLEYVFNTSINSTLTDESLISAAALSSTKFVVTYSDSDNSDYGTGLIGNYVCPVIGIARESGDEGDTVPVIIGGVSDIHTSLTPGAIYYSDASGNLTTTESNCKIGLSISNQDIILDINTY